MKRLPQLERSVGASADDAPYDKNPPGEGTKDMDQRDTSESHARVAKATPPERMTRLRRMLREQIAGELQHDLDGGESLTKEIWEQCENDEEQRAVRDEIRAIMVDILVNRAGGASVGDLAGASADTSSPGAAPVAWQYGTPPRNVRCLVTWTGPDSRSLRVKVASVSPDHNDERWFSEGERIHGVIAWMLAPPPAAATRAAHTAPDEAIAAAVRSARHDLVPPAWMWGRSDSPRLLAAWSEEKERLVRANAQLEDQSHV